MFNLSKSKKIDKPAIDWTNPKVTLAAIKNYIVETAESEENWYTQWRGINGFITRSVRFITLLLFGFGLIFPLLNIEKVTLFNHTINSLGYLCLAVGGLILLFDKYFGLSSGFVRFYIAEEEIRKNLGEFELNWEIEMAKAENNKYSTEAVLNTLATAKILRQSVSNAIQLETSAWAAEFQTQIGELQELLKQKLSEYKESKLGTISVKIENYETYKDIELILDETSIKKLNGTTSAIFRDVSLTTHQIQIRANKDGTPISFSENFDVVADKTTELTMKLP